MAAADADAYLAALPDGPAEIGRRLRSIIESELPDATPRMYHAIPVWSVGAEPTVGIKGSSTGVALLLFRGQRIADPTGRLVPSGSFEMASVKLGSAAEVDEPAIRDWLRSAARADGAA